MGECNLDQIEWLDLRDCNYTAGAEDRPSRWDLIERNADIPWQSESLFTGENENGVASSGLRRKSQIYHIEKI